MKKNILKALILSKKGNHNAAALGHDIKNWLQRRGVQSEIVTIERLKNHQNALNENVLIIALGGDGTILGASRELAGSQTQIFGINFGRVGFLTGADGHDWKERLYSLLKGEAKTHNFSVLQWRLERNGNMELNGVAVNDLVIGRGALARLATLEIRANGYDLGIARCDGAIFCTPLGSSGYSVSAGGPLLYPFQDCIGLTPVSPFMPGMPPMVFPGSAKFEAVVLSPTVESFLTSDGQEGVRLQRDDKIFINSMTDALKIFLDEEQFFKRLKNRGLLPQ